MNVANINTNMESLDQMNYCLKLQRIGIVLFAMLSIPHNGTVIQNQDTIYVLLVTGNSKE
uniref:Uncharacterized protein n=1 Tax=Meloidogyne enterolobii TaxID=390850 RepID=A0A6V7XRJ0_MELEN|nr:unnamed protein product [Meloidogyne enterolobii]